MMSYFAATYSDQHQAWWDAAAQAHENGVPSSLPSENIYKTQVEDHRWGRHRTHLPYCPACVNPPRSATSHEGEGKNGR